MINPVWEQPQP